MKKQTEKPINIQDYIKTLIGEKVKNHEKQWLRSPKQYKNELVDYMVQLFIWDRLPGELERNPDCWTVEQGLLRKKKVFNVAKFAKDGKSYDTVIKEKTNFDDVKDYLTTVAQHYISKQSDKEPIDLSFLTNKLTTWKAAMEEQQKEAERKAQEEREAAERKAKAEREAAERKKQAEDLKYFTIACNTPKILCPCNLSYHELNKNFYYQNSDDYWLFDDKSGERVFLKHYISKDEPKYIQLEVRFKKNDYTDWNSRYMPLLRRYIDNLSSKNASGLFNGIKVKMDPRFEQRIQLKDGQFMCEGVIIDTNHEAPKKILLDPAFDNRKPLCQCLTEELQSVQTLTTQQNSNGTIDILADNKPFIQVDDHGFLIKITLNHVKEIPENTFRRFHRLTSVFTNAEVLGTCACENCENLTSLICPNIKKIKDNACYNCKHLETVNLGDETRTTPWNIDIGLSAFAETAVKKITPPKNTNLNLAQSAFENSALQEISGILKAKEYAFSECKDLSKISFNNGAIIKDYLCTNCWNITEIHFPENLTIVPYAYPFTRTGCFRNVIVHNLNNTLHIYCSTQFRIECQQRNGIIPMKGTVFHTFSPSTSTNFEIIGLPEPAKQVDFQKGLGNQGNGNSGRSNP